MQRISSRSGPATKKDSNTIGFSSQSPVDLKYTSFFNALYWNITTADGLCLMDYFSSENGIDLPSLPLKHEKYSVGQGEAFCTINIE